ncbi:hypothetical protein CIL05_06825 [Virgibacillus profundi]|uniref:Uncharacterized protein n=1 Tax=Virgibacillus profundi TaxID=2024555 RepID=A0A2A2IGB7_9BACI|nr:hypothetical protein [Virgibacillus profundi]PAV30175.1 hypothetical protein CIL05_06825 [Virgibacillus profundi]PXY54347.1 hypothetical protein CIT14_06910 [Virgibacillus profundi]
MKEQISVKPKILDLQSTNDIYMTLNIRILSNKPNLNGAVFTSDFIEKNVQNKDKLIGIPFVVDRDRLEEGDFTQLSHNLTADGELGTDQIGSFVDFWQEEDGDTLYLCGQIRVMKRYSRVCEAIVELFSESNLNTSCEILVQGYEEITDDGIRKIHYNDGRNALFASCLVSNPADVNAKGTLLIAEAYEQDIKNQKGDVIMPNNNKQDKIETFNKGVEVKYHGVLETSALKWHEVRDKVFNLVNPYNAEKDEREYNYMIMELFTSYLILEDWDNFDVLYKASYEIDGDTITIAPKEDWQVGSYGFIPEGIELNSIIVNHDAKLVELNKELDKTKEELETMSKEKQTDVELNEAKIKELEEKVVELNATIVSEQEAKQALEVTITELSGTVDELTPFKEQVETAKKEKETAELTEKYSKLITKEVFASERVTKAIEELDSVELNSVVVEEIAKQKQTDLETASTKDKDVVIAATQGKDLITYDKDASYWASPRS